MFKPLRSFSLLLLALAACASPGAAPKPDGIVERSIDGQKLTIKVMGFKSTWEAPPDGPVEEIAAPYDVIIVGGGLSGLTAGWYLRDKNVVILERKDEAGGLAFRGVTEEGVVYARGSAYYSRPEGRCKKIYEELGMDAIEKTVIPEPIDSYFREGRLITHMWEEDSLKLLPDGFRKFKEAILKEDADGAVAIQPIEHHKNLKLDKITMAEYIKPFGDELKAYLDSYGQSALGGRTDDVNALAFINFYLSEIGPRHSWPGGSAGASVHLIKKIRDFKPGLLKTGHCVTKVKNDGDRVVVEYYAGGRNFRARAKAVIMAVPLRVTNQIMEDYPADRKALLAKLTYADYLVHSVFTSRDLCKATYDTWFINRSFTDVIAARWIETKGFTETAKPGPGVLSIYQPLEPRRGVKELDPDTVADLLVSAVKELGDYLPDLKKEKDLVVESYRWPASIHIVPVNFFSEWVPKLTPPVGRVYFAANNLGTPAFEEATYRGWKAAQDLRKLLSVAPVQKRDDVLVVSGAARSAEESNHAYGR